MDSRYMRAQLIAHSRARESDSPFDLAASTIEATRRLMSHSHGPGGCLVEIVDVENDVSLGRGESAEIE